MRSLLELQQQCSSLVDGVFRRDDGWLRSTVWLTEDEESELAEYEQPCSAPSHVSDAAVIQTLCEEMAADFAYDGVTRFAVGFTGQVEFVGVGCALLAHPPSIHRRVVVIEAHDRAICIVGTREIERSGRWPRLGPLQQHAHAKPRFGGLLARRRPWWRRRRR